MAAASTSSKTTEITTAAAGKVVPRPANRIGAKCRRGFAAMSAETQRRIASQGGKASHASGRGHVFTAAEAREAGRKGGLISRRK